MTAKLLKISFKKTINGLWDWDKLVEMMVRLKIGDCARFRVDILHTFEGVTAAANVKEGTRLISLLSLNTLPPSGQPS